MDTFLKVLKPNNLIWGLDANNKHKTWHSSITDIRGATIVESLSSLGLSVNEKDGPTYSGPNGVSRIDITVTSNSAHRVKDWGMSEVETHSDDNLTIFNILPSRTITSLSRQTVDTTKKFATKAGKWNIFKQEVQQINEKWKALIKDFNVNDQLEIPITTIWKELGDISKNCFPPYQPI